jgi:hypothetical protein
METIPCQLIKLNCIIKAVEEGQNTSDQHLSNIRKTMRAGDIVAAVTATIVSDWQLTVRELVAFHGLSCGIIIAILAGDLGLVKKSAWHTPNYGQQYRTKSSSGL